MSAMSNEIPKRKRQNDVKKWTEEDIKKVLNYMQVHRHIEKPTAQVYYKKLLEDTKVDASWNILKCKVRHLKSTLQKADTWSNSTGAGVEDGDGASTVRDKVLKICPYYDQLSDIFYGAREIEEVIMDTCSDYIEYSQFDAPDIDEDDSLLEIDEPTTSSAEVSFLGKVKRRRQNTCIDKLATMEALRTDFRENQLALESEKFNWAKEVEKKRLEMEQQKLQMEQQKIDNDFQIKKLELEQNEKIQMFEIEMKYRNKK